MNNTAKRFENSKTLDDKLVNTEQSGNFIFRDPDLESKVFIFSDFLHDNDLKHRIREAHQEHADSDIRVYTYPESIIGSRNSMGVLGDWGPSVVYAVNKYHGLHLPYRESNMDEFAYSKLCHLACTLYKGMMFNHSEIGVAASKIYNLKSVATIMKHPELIVPEEILNENNYRQVLFEVAKNVNRLMEHVNVEHLDGEPLLKKAEPHRLSYVDELKNMFGNRLRSILLYGSSARGEGSDYDNLVVLDKIVDSDFERINNHPLFEKGKEVGCIFLEENSVDKFLYINVSNRVFKDKAKVLYGEMSFPSDNINYSKRKEQYHVGFGSAKLVSALNLAFKEPHLFADKFGLLEYFIKINRFTLHGLKQQDIYKSIGKDKLYDELKEDYDYDIRSLLANKRELNDKIKDPEFVQELFLDANILSSQLSYRLHNPKKARRGGEEFLLKTLDKINGDVYLSSLEAVPVFLFKRKEKINIDDIIPTTVYRKNNPKFNELDKRLRKSIDKSNYFFNDEKKIELPEKYFIGIRM